ncbi:PAS domain-containing protein, partial [bacterium]|nr:PAS domain-containing protein [bacterium]
MNIPTTALTKNLLKTMPGSLFIISPDYKINQINPATCQLLGYQEVELINQPVSMIFGQKEIWTEITKIGFIKGHNMALISKTGEKIASALSGTALINKAGQLAGIIIIALDMRTYQKTEQELDIKSNDLKIKVKKLEDARTASFHMLKDIHNSQKELVQRNQELEDAKKELEAALQKSSESKDIMQSLMEDTFEAKQQIEITKVKIEELNKELETKVQQRTFELSVLYETSNAISYLLDFKALMILIMNQIRKVVPYDLCGALIYTTRETMIFIKPAQPEMNELASQIKMKLVSRYKELTNKEITQSTLKELVLPASRKKDKKPISNLKISTFFDLPLRVRGRIVGIFQISTCAKKGFKENEIRFFKAIVNQTSSVLERLRSVIAIEKSKMQSMVESMTEGMLLTDEKGTISIINPAAREMLGIEMTEEVTLDFVLAHFTEPTKIKDMLIKIIKGQSTSYSQEVVSKAHPDQIFKIDLEPIKGSKGIILGSVSVIHDITQEKKIDRMKSEFISTVSHELRTPLSVIQGVISNLIDGIVGEFTPKQKEYLEIADQDSQRLAHLIDDLLDLSKLEAGKLELVTVPSNLEMLVDKSIFELKLKIDEKNIILGKQFSKNLPEVSVDPDKIMEVLLNLLSNAVKFTPTNGKIIFLAKIKDAHNLQVSVQDTGIGISKKDIPKLFS